MKPSYINRRFLLVLLTCVSIILLATPVFAAEKIIARLTNFSGVVLIKSQGSWELDPVKGLPLYSEDKVVTRIGTAIITFDDGGILEIKKNSNLLISEIEEKKGIFRRVKVVKRRIRLLLGKLIFKTGRASKKETILESATMVCGLRGTSGTISIGADGQTYIQFTDGGPSFTIGEFISGLAEDVPDELAKLHPVQRAAFVAKAAADQAKRAAKKAQDLIAAGEGETTEGQEAQAQLAYARALAAERAAQEAKAAAQIMIENNPSSEVVERATEVVEEADEAIDEAKDAQEDAVEAGATPGEPEPYVEPEKEPGEPEPFEEPEEPGFDVELPDEPPIEDTGPASPG